MIGYDGITFNAKEYGIESVESLWEKLQNMNADELFKFSQQVNCYVFFMYEYSAELKMKTLYDLQNCEYLSYDGTTHVDYVSNTFLYVNDYIRISIKGTLEELTDAPLLLNQLIEQDPNLDYDNLNKILKIQPDEQSLNSVNALLKNPLYEIRYLTIQEIYEIEQTLNKKL